MVETETPRSVTFQAIVRIALSALVVTCILQAAPVARAIHGAEGDEALQQLLARLGLGDLQVAHLEQRLRSSGTDDPGQRLAEQLADLYAARLMRSAGEQARYDDTLARIRDLIRRFPKANTTALQVMLLQADYSRAETLISTWINDARNTKARKQATEILTRIAPLLVKFQQTLNEQAEKLLRETEQLPEGDALRTAEQRLRRVQGVAARATYFAAWADYYLAMVTDAPPKAMGYQRARSTFRKLLGLEDDQPMSEVEAEWLGLESIWKARALIGLGLSEAACGNVEASEQCFGFLEHGSVAVSVKRQAPYWHVRALIRANRWDRAIEYAHARVRNFKGKATQGQVSFCVALVRAATDVDAKGTLKQRRALRDLGLSGLARLGQLHALEQLVDKHDLSADKDSGFILHWVRGQRAFARAEQAKEKEGYKQAAEMLQNALAAPDAGSLAGPAASCRYTLAWCYFRQDMWAKAADEFTKAVRSLKAAADPLAPEAAWMAFVAYRRLAEKQPQFVSAASDALKRLGHEFPNHAYAKRIDYELAKLLGSSSPESTIQQLETIQPGNSNYRSARYDLCLLWHQRWSKDKRNQERAEPLLESLRQAADVYLKAADSEEYSKRKVKICLLVADAALRNAARREDVAEAFLSRAEPWAAKLPAADPVAAEYHYRTLRLATLQKNDSIRRRHAQWLADHAAGSPYEKAALVILASALDKAAGKETSAANRSLLEQAYTAFRRLRDVLGDSPGALASSKNAQVALSRMAYYAERLDRPDEAADLLEKLLVALPRQRKYLRRAGLAEFRAGRFDKSLARWRALLAGLKRGSDAWYEAKYYQLQCLARTDKAHAARVFKQFKLLYPDLGGKAWRDKFQQVANRL